MIPKVPWWVYAIAALVVVTTVIGAIHAYGSAREKEGRREAIAERALADQKKTDEHNATIGRLNREYKDQLAALEGERDRLLAHPVERVIRVPVRSLCPAPRDAGVPATRDPEPVDVAVPDAGYGVFRDWLIRYAAGSRDGGRSSQAVPDRR